VPTKLKARLATWGVLIISTLLGLFLLRKRLATAKESRDRAAYDQLSQELKAKRDCAVSPGYDSHGPTRPGRERQPSWHVALLLAPGGAGPSGAFRGVPLSPLLGQPRATPTSPERVLEV